MPGQRGTREDRARALCHLLGLQADDLRLARLTRMAAAEVSGMIEDARRVAAAIEGLEEVTAEELAARVLRAESPEGDALRAAVAAEVASGPPEPEAGRAPVERPELLGELLALQRAGGALLERVERITVEVPRGMVPAITEDLLRLGWVGAGGAGRTLTTERARFSRPVTT